MRSKTFKYLWNISGYLTEFLFDNYQTYFIIYL